MSFFVLMAAALLHSGYESEREKMSPGEAIELAQPEDWITIPAEDLLLVDLEGGKRIAFQLAPQWAPVHVANIRRFADSGYWEGASVYRVQDNYVAQFGLLESDRPNPDGVIDNPPPEYVRSAEGLDLTLLGSPDPYAMVAGFSDGWPVAIYEDGTASLTHCYGTLGAGRDLSPNTGSGAELYAIIGHAPRHLDRNIAIVGRAVDGIEHLSSLPRGSGPLGFLVEEKGEKASLIVSIRLASSLPEDERPSYQYLSEDSAAFARYLDVRSNRYDDFYDVPAGGVALCNVQVPVRPSTDD